MAIVMQMKWDGVTPDQYDQMQKEVDWVSEAPKGGIFHVAWFEDGALRVVDAWQSAEEFQAFVDQRLMPGVAKVGVAGGPEVTVLPLHRVYDAAHNEILI
jgi:hypothetical protein